MPTERLTLTGHASRPLDARLERPDGVVRAFALFAHCFTCGKDSLAASRVSRGLAARGIATLRFDFTGLEEDGDGLDPAGFSADVADVVAAAEAMAKDGRAPRLLVGHSLGGAAVLAAAGAIASVRAVATIAAPLDAAHVLEQLPDAVSRIEAEGEATVTLAGRPVTLTRAFVEDVRAQRQAERLGGLRCGLLVLHSPTDATVGVEQAGAIFAAARHPKSFVALAGADHLLTRAADADYAAAVIAAWSERYLEAAGDA